MSKRIETEKKYFCANNEELIELVNALKFKLISSGVENDEYFTDINSEYVKNRTCLRIRNTDDLMQVTFKGKSKDFQNAFCKLESNYNVSKESYDDFINLFSNLGFYTYTMVNKTRSTYQIKDKKYSYSIMIDTIEDIGGFVEFELICEDDNYDEIELKNKLNDFINKFSELNLEEALLPYRDFLALKLYNEYKPKKEIKGVHLNIDSFLKKYEKDFYNYYKMILKGKVNLQAFREDVYDISEEDKKRLNNYFDNLKIQDSKFIILFELLKQIKNLGLDIVLSTNCSKSFIDNLLLKVFKKNIVDKTIYLNNNKAVYNELKKYNVDLNNYFNINKLDLKNTNSLLLVIINNFDITSK